MANWLILDNAGNPASLESLAYRPNDANDSNGNPYTPWHRTEEHLHIEGGKITGIHAQGTQSELAAVLKVCQKHQDKILAQLQPAGDSLALSEALKYLVTIQ